jgi:hypothetical protein
MMVLPSCTSTHIQELKQEEATLLTIDGKEIELVSDEYDNYYLKQHLPQGGVIYVPYTFLIEEEEIPRVYEAKY